MKKIFKSTIAILLATMYTTMGCGYSKMAYANEVITKSTDNEELKVSKTYSGFKLSTKNYIDEAKSTAYQFIHEKSGANIMFLHNEDNEKFFTMTFRTPPNDNTGVNHIIEHSVLYGSRKYNVKDPVRQMQGSILNGNARAVTIADATTYLMSSNNHKGFENLIDVLLDAVYYPNMHKNEKIFKLEGWRYDLESKDSELKYNGSVYNEEKGYYSDFNRVLCDKIEQSLFPNSIYKWDASGKHESIPNLTWQEVINTHKKYYIPSNSFTFMYGNVNIKETLKFINDKYLCNFKNIKVNSSISAQKPFKERLILKDEYPIPQGKDTKNKTYIAVNYGIENIKDKETTIGLSTLSQLLFNYSSSPLKKALNKSGLAENFDLMNFGGQLQTVYSIVAENTNEVEKTKIEKLIEDTLKKVVQEGFDKELIESCLNSYERKMLNKQDRSMSYAFSTAEQWLYGNDPIQTFKTIESISTIKQKISNRYYEKLIEKYLLNNKHISTVILKPVAGLEEKNTVDLKDKLAKIKSKFSKKQIEDILKDTEEFNKWQDKPDSDEALKAFPVLKLSDIDVKASEVPTVVKKENDITVLYHPLSTNNMSYANLYFDTSKVPQDKLMYINLLGKMLGGLDTEKYDATSLAKEFNNYTGKIKFSMISYADKSNHEKYYPKMKVSMNTINRNLNKGFELLNEIMYNTKFSDEDEIRNLIKDIRMQTEDYINQYVGDEISQYHIKSYLSDNGKYSDLAMLPFYKFICDLDDNFDKKSSDIINNLKEVNKMVFNKDDLIVSFTSDEDNYNNFKKSFSDFSNKIHNFKYGSQKYIFDFSIKNEAFIMPSDVQYIFKGGDYGKAGYENSGKLKVLEEVLNQDYMIKEIMTKGGAYEAYFRISDSNVIFSSFYDPNLKETLDAYDKSSDYLRNFNADKQKMIKYIIGAISSIEVPSSALNKGEFADKMYITKTSQADLQKIREEILSTTSEDIRNYADMIDKIIKQNNILVIGVDEKINDCKNVFDKIQKLMAHENK